MVFLNWEDYIHFSRHKSRIKVNAALIDFARICNMRPERRNYKMTFVAVSTLDPDMQSIFRLQRSMRRLLVSMR